MKILYISIIVTLASVLLISFLSHANADTIPGPYFPPTKDLTEAQKQSLLQEAISVPGVKAWSDKWQFSSVDYAGTKTPTPHWQTVTLRLYLQPNAPAPKSCSSGWVAFVVFDYATGKILNSVYPNSTSTCIDSNRIVKFQDPQMNILSGESPLKQFKSGISAQDVICKEGLQLIIKAEDNLPACVKSKSAAVLILHGWASEAADGQIIYFMKSNSTGKLIVKYNSAQYGGPWDLNARIYNGSSMYQIQPSIIEAEVNPNIILGNSNTTVVYTVTSHDAKGVYWLSLDVCRFVPIVVDLDNSKITNSDLQLSISGWRCPVSLLQYKIVGFEGIEPEYVRIEK